MTPAQQLRRLLDAPGLLVMPGCYDAFSARLIQRAGFKLTFMGGFAVSASRIGMPDTGLISYAEMVDQARNICGAVSIPVIGDGDTGYGNALNVQRTVQGYARAGLACVMLRSYPRQTSRFQRRGLFKDAGGGGCEKRRGGYSDHGAHRR